MMIMKKMSYVVLCAGLIHHPFQVLGTYFGGFLVFRRFFRFGCLFSCRRFFICRFLLGFLLGGFFSFFSLFLVRLVFFGLFLLVGFFFFSLLGLLFIFLFLFFLFAFFFLALFRFLFAALFGGGFGFLFLQLGFLALERDFRLARVDLGLGRGHRRRRWWRRLLHFRLGLRRRGWRRRWLGVGRHFRRRRGILHLQVPHFRFHRHRFRTLPVYADPQEKQQAKMHRQRQAQRGPAAAFARHPVRDAQYMVGRFGLQSSVFKTSGSM